MARSARNFDPIVPLNQRWFYFDFGSDLGSGETIVSGTLTASVTRGVDANPQSHILSSPMIVGSEVGAFCGNFLAGVTYSLEAIAVTSDDNVLELNARVRCQDPADR